jgi:hypothetical protein
MQGRKGTFDPGQKEGMISSSRKDEVAGWVPGGAFGAPAGDGMQTLIRQ